MWQRSLLVMGSIAVVLIVIEVFDAATPAHDLDSLGIVSRQADGLDGILWSPFLHLDFEHLFANLVPGMVLGFLLLMSRRFLVVTAIVWVLSGAGVWLFGPAYTLTVGASGIVFGWLAYLLIRGIFNRDLWQLLIGVVVFAVYGSILWGVLPSDNGTSWQAHLFGAIGGVLAAWYLTDRDRRSAANAGPDRTQLSA